MTELYAYCLIPVLSVSVLLGSSALLHGARARGLAAYCGSIALWSGMLLVTYVPEIAWIGRRGAACGALVAASFMHAAYEVSGQRDYRLVWFAYVVGAVITATGVFVPGLLYDPVSLRPGPMFWPSMALAVVAAGVPMVMLVRAWREAEAPAKVGQMRWLAIAGTGGYLGAWFNAWTLSRGVVRPWGILMVLGSLFLLARVVRSAQRPGRRRLLERSLIYAALAAFLSAGFLFGVLSLMPAGAEPLLGSYRLGALFIVCMAALAFEPLRQHLQETLGRLLTRDRAAATDLAERLAHQEERADQAERLAELGAFTSAIAHEVRNPLGVLSACLRVLELEDVDPETLDEMRQQVRRAGDFLDELLAYGRPRPLELRVVELEDVVELAASQARQAVGDDGVEVDLEGVESATVEVDQGQLMQVVVILVENALHALHERGSTIRVAASRSDEDEVTLVVADDGPGLPDAIADRIFEPFVTGRRRDGPRTGTGLGLAIARRIVERHEGHIEAGRDPDLGGARFEVRLPRYQRVLGAATGARDDRASE
jgi:signal transduction histidine kinase